MIKWFVAKNKFLNLDKTYNEIHNKEFINHISTFHITKKSV